MATLTTQLKRKIKSIIKKDFIKKNEIIDFSINGDEGFGFVKVIMPSTCEVNTTMTWEFTYSYTPSNIEVFTEIEKLQFPELITKEVLTIEEF